MAYGAVWMIAMRWSIRAIGFLNTIILARILVPEDFGLVAMATILYGRLTALTEFGLDLTLIREKAPTRDHYDSAWTLNLCVGVAKCLMLAVLAPLLAIYYGDKRIETLVYIICVAP